MIWYGLAVQLETRAEHVGSASKQPLPETVTEYDDAVPSFLVLARRKCPAHEGGRREHVEVGLAVARTPSSRSGLSRPVAFTSPTCQHGVGLEDPRALADDRGRSARRSPLRDR